MMEMAREDGEGELSAAPPRVRGTKTIEVEDELLEDIREPARGRARSPVLNILPAFAASMLRRTA